MTLVVGATGLLGFEVVKRLRSHGHQVRALCRTPSDRTKALGALGAEVVAGDLKDPSSLRAACDGQEAVVSTATAVARRSAGDSLRTVDRDGQLALVEAARSAGVRRFVYVSVSPHLRGTSALVRYKREVEAAVKASGMEWVVLQPSAFMETWLSPLLGWDLRAARARIVGTGRSRTSLVSVHDVAGFAVAAVEQLDLANREVPLGGPDALSANEFLALAQALTGRVFRVQRIPAFVPRALSLLLRPVAAVPASLMDLAAQSAAQDDLIDSAELARQLGLALTSVRDFAIKVVTEDQGAQPELRTENGERRP